MDKYSGKTEEEILESLLVEYSDDEDAVDMINRTISELPYLRSKTTGQTARQHVYELIGVLSAWH